ncbi:DegT/DnrJ/EryC1/StrS family aminotransferase [Clostridium estertheticum]|uniref:DegT/DnrJ/EryC1/StrS family aminotransferase n=1 Tax=Clostridium estertheticum TaxID=238834 RepID=UPI001C6F534D|nr:DegT/DnrJ/EryC1/StrS family aminotransferase [Clostridium estertheticum]MBW9173898.1 DegT/DnrJ/EryC1/StrS family aminotransferase [Clostridium estertheticum]WLC74910.1 DegT/DnrJ/EryC1/StrS family aminotransferase [Clostridium estertheticum]
MDKSIFVTRPSMPPIEEYIKEIEPIWESAWLTNLGKYHNQLEKQLSEYLGVEKISLFTNGHMALELVIQAMNLSGEVITTPFTFASTTHAIVRNGLTPVFCDVNPNDYTIDVEKIEKLITDKTSAIIPVHVYGNICNMSEIEKIAKKYDLKVIYDAAHAFGEKINGKGIGNFGDASMFSFHATKVFNTIEGGAVTFSASSIGTQLYILKNFGIQSDVSVNGVGSNAKMNEFQAAMGICNLRHVTAEILKRKIVVERYRKWLSNVNGIKVMNDVKEIQSNYSYFPVVFDEKVFGFTRNEICDRLSENNIFARKYFYPLTNTFECYHGKFDVSKTPIAQYIAKRVLTLPLYADLSIDDVDRICNIILEGYQV